MGGVGVGSISLLNGKAIDTFVVNKTTDGLGKFTLYSGLVLFQE